MSGLYHSFHLTRRLSFHALVNGFVHFLRKFPVLGKHLGDTFRFRAFKKATDALAVPVSFLVDIVKQLLFSGICLSFLFFIHHNILPEIPSYQPLLQSQGGVNGVLFYVGAFPVLYSASTFLTSLLLNGGGRLVEWRKIYHMSPTHYVRIAGILEPLMHFVSRSIVWVGVYALVLGYWSAGEALAFSLVHLLLQWSLERWNMRRGMRGDDEDQPAFWVVLKTMFPYLVAIVLIIGLLWLRRDVRWAGYVAVLVLALPAFFGVRFLLRFAMHDALFEHSVSSQHKLEKASEAGIAKMQVELKEKDLKVRQTSAKKGYAFLNDLFFQRHARLISRPVRRRLIAVTVVLTIFTVLFQRIAAEESFAPVLFFLPFVMYILCNQSKIAEAMYLNCDVGLLHYGFYKQPQALLAMFRERAKSMMRLFLLPTMVVEGFFVLNAILVRLAWPEFAAGMLLILVYGLFFAIWPLFVYYVLQPFDVDGTPRSWPAGVLNMVIYFYCYFSAFLLSNWLAPLAFAVGSLVFFLIFLPVAYRLILRRAPKAMLQS